MRHSNGPPTIPFGNELPILDESNKQSRCKAKGKHNSEKARTGGRFQTINAFVDFTLASLTPAEISVWLVLWRDTKPSGVAGTGQTDLARRAGISDRSVRTAIKLLESKGLLEVVKRGGLRRGVSVYWVKPINSEQS
jgi:hypothetical protein